MDRFEPLTVKNSKKRTPDVVERRPPQNVLVSALRLLVCSSTKKAVDENKDVRDDFRDGKEGFKP